MSAVSALDLDYSSMTSEEHSSALDYEAEITAHLTVNSLILLGFNTDEYTQIYSGIAFDITPVNTKTFDKPNERMLFVILHYLLCILDREEFLLSIEKCWPFLDNKERNQFRKALHISLIRLIERGVMPNSLYQQSLLTTASGNEIWSLLHFLTDRALDQVLQQFRENQFPEQTNNAHIHSSAFPTSFLQNEHSHPHSNYHNKDDENSTDPGNNSIVSSSLTGGTNTREVLINQIDERVHDVKVLILQFNDERKQWEEYLRELDHRLALAKKSIKATEQKLRELHLQDEYNILAEQGRAKRTKLLARVAAQKQLLNSFLNSPLLTDVDKYVQEEATVQENESKEKAAAILLDQSAIAKLEKANAPTRRKKMLSKAELEAYKISMRDAISTLVDKIEEVGSLV
jgi:hypothetical protein